MDLAAFLLSQVCLWQKRHHKYIPVSFLAVNDYVISCVHVFVVVHVTFSVVHARCSSTCAKAHDVMLASALKDYLTHMFTAFPPTAWTGDPALTVCCGIMFMGCIARNNAGVGFHWWC
jgi:hypothetical protein